MAKAPLENGPGHANLFPLILRSMTGAAGDGCDAEGRDAEGH
ncbi:hypothetical protein [Azospirillum palustre]